MHWSWEMLSHQNRGNNHSDPGYWPFFFFFMIQRQSSQGSLSLFCHLDIKDCPVADCLQLDSDLAQVICQHSSHQTNKQTKKKQTNKQIWGQLLKMVSNFKPCIVCEKSIDSKQLAAHHALHIQVKKQTNNPP